MKGKRKGGAEGVRADLRCKKGRGGLGLMRERVFLGVRIYVWSVLESVVRKVVKASA